MMGPMKLFLWYNKKRRSIAVCSLALCFMLVLGALSAEDPAIAAKPSRVMPFRPGETLMYDISWSNIVTAGTAVMEVKEGTMPDGKRVLRFVVTTHSAGLVNAFYRVNDRLESVFDLHDRGTCRDDIGPADIVHQCFSRPERHNA